MSQTASLRICVTCRRDPEAAAAPEERDGARLYARLEAERQRLAEAGIGLSEVRCLSGCKRACTALLTGAGKWSYVLCEVDPETAAGDLVDYAERYAASADGQVAWRERPESLRRKTLARIPPLEPAAPTSDTNERDEAA